MSTDRAARGMAKRVEVLGEQVVSRLREDTSDVNTRWQAFITEFAWGECWSDETLSVRERTLLVLGMVAGQRRADEFEGHLRNALRNGMTEDQLTAIVIQVAVYCGVPTGNMCTRALKNVLAENHNTGTQV